jgi:hypothetical protein
MAAYWPGGLVRNGSPYRTGNSQFPCRHSRPMIARSDSVRYSGPAATP